MKRKKRKLRIRYISDLYYDAPATTYHFALCLVVVWLAHSVQGDGSTLEHA